MKSLKMLMALAMFLGILNPNSFAREFVGAKKQRKTTVPTAALAANCIAPSEATELDINNVRALIQTGGDMWRELQGQARYEVPKGSGNNAMFAGALWLGGQDVSGQLKVAAQRFRTNGQDFWTGPLSKVTSEIDARTCQEWDRHFLTTRDEVATFVAWNNAKALAANGDPNALDDFVGYKVPQSIIDWPAHGRQGDPYNEDLYLAPFIDVNGDELYSYIDGDYPAYDLKGKIECTRQIENIYGDQNLWWIFNDKGNVHTESGSAAIGLEIRAQAFAFATNDAINNMTFYNYELHNRSTFTLTQTYFGSWVDGDLGGAFDDHVGCDVMRGLGYFYNAEDVDLDANGAKGYGANPPAIGVDFFQGPFQDNDGIANQIGIGENEALNGVGYGDTEVDNERFGMRRFLYHNNLDSPIGDPNTGSEYYNYLRGFWRDGTPMTYGGTGYNPADPTAVKADFMFPGNTDPMAWGTGGVPQADWTAQGGGADRRFIQSAGPFTLEPGNVNNITIGVLWERATSGGPLASVAKLRQADDKAQSLFDNCFKLVNPPDAPNMTIQEMDKELILYLSNPSVSNNFNEEYAQVNPFLNPPDSIDTDGNDTIDTPLTDEEKRLYQTFHFQGYKIYQVKNKAVAASDLKDPDLARLIFQCDLEDDVDQLVNFYFDDDLKANVPVEEVDGENKGIRHSFRVTEDQFAEGDNRLVNHKSYYFIAVAYAVNQFGEDFGNLQFIEEEYDPSDPLKLDGQKEPYLGSRKAAFGGIKPYFGIPHKTEVESGGLTLNSSYGDGVEVTRIEGRGNGGNSLRMKQESIDQIMAGAPWKVAHPTYEAGSGPVQVKVIDPLNVKGGDYTLAFKEDTENDDLKEGYWTLTGEELEEAVVSDRSISIENEQLLFDLGISITVGQVEAPGLRADFTPTENNGLLEASIEFEDESHPWLSGVEDEDGFTLQNWIRSGKSQSTDNADTPIDESAFNDMSIKNGTDDVFLDPDSDYENLLSGTWSPARLTSFNTHGPIAGDIVLTPNEMRHLQSVDIVFTDDRSKWTRCPVLEMSDDPQLSLGGAEKGFLRASRSVDQNGVAGADGDTQASDDPNSPNYISAFGMGWFPGYAINLETGERLNMAFGEDSWLQAENGRDMQWNPTTQITEGFFNNVRFGGKHYIYVFRNNVIEDNVGSKETVNPSQRMPMYDAGKWMHNVVSTATNEPSLRNVYRAAMWIGLPRLAVGEELLSNKATVHLRVNRPYSTYATQEFISPADALVPGATYFVDKGPVEHGGQTYEHGQYFTASNSNFSVPATFIVDGNTINNEDVQDNLVLTENSALPLYNFNLDALAPSNNQGDVAKDMLSEIYIVPNPYYAYSSYESGKNENLVKIINLPQTCKVTIYTLNGTLVRTMEKDDPTITSIDWDLKNQTNVPIASGTYIVHIDVPGVGERILKWFGAIRPINLDSF